MAVILKFMRRAICAALLAVSTIGFFALPVGADPTGSVLASSKFTMSFDFSDNSSPASASNGVFNVTVDVLPAHSPGVVRMVAIAPADSGNSNLVCTYQTIVKSQVECGFDFTTSGIWSIHVQLAPDTKSDVEATAVTDLRVGN